MNGLLNSLLERYYGDTPPPEWAANLTGGVASTLELLAIAFAVWLLSSLIKRSLRALGRRQIVDEQEFEGSAWDLGASLSQFIVLLIGAPLVLTAIGFEATTYLSTHAIGIVTAIVILVSGVVIARWVSKSIRSFGHRAHRKDKADDTLFMFFASMVRYIVIGFAAVFALRQVGFAPSSLLAIVGAAGLAIALALQDTLRAVAAGFLLAVFRPFKIGDWVGISGAEGEVIDITPFHVTIKPVDNRTVILPNDKAWSEPITNYNKLPERRLDFYVDISREDDIHLALRVLREAIASVPRIRRQADIWTGVHTLKDYSVQLRARPWVAAKEFVDFRSDCYIAVVQAFNAAGITIPYPQQIEYQADYVRPARPVQADTDPSQ